MLALGQQVNSPTNGFCSRRDCPLDARTAMLMRDEESKTDFVIDKLAADPEFEEFVRPCASGLHDKSAS